MQGKVSVMKNLIGNEIAIRFSDGGIVKGKLIEDYHDRLVLSDEDDKITFVIKRHISAFTILGEYSDASNMRDTMDFVVLRCSNQKDGCNGVQLLKCGLVDETDYVFMSECPCLNERCSGEKLGSFVELSQEQQKDMLDNLLLGDYPKKKRGRPKGARNES